MKKWKSCWGTAYFFSKNTCENKAENIRRHFKTTLFRFGVQFYEFKVCRIINSFGRKCLDFWKCDYLFNMYWASPMGGCGIDATGSVKKPIENLESQKLAYTLLLLQMSPVRCSFPKAMPVCETSCLYFQTATLHCGQHLLCLTWTWHIWRGIL